MNKIKRLIPNNIKFKIRYFLLDLLKIPYSRNGVPLEILKWLPKNKKITFVDIGANVGNFSLSIVKEYEVEKGLLIEPISKLAPILENKFPDRKIFQIFSVAASDINEETDFYLHEKNDFVSSLLKISEMDEAIISLNLDEPVLTKTKTFTLDRMVSEQKIAQIDLIKIDVQGAEHLVLKGASETLQKTRFVFTEFSFKPLYENSSVFFDLYRIMNESNFALVNISPGYSAPNGELLQGDALFINRRLTE